MKNLILTVGLILALATNANANFKTDFFENLIKMGRGHVDDVVKKLPKPGILKKQREVLSKNIHLPKLKKAVQQVPEKAILANSAEKIMKKGKFEDSFFTGQKFDNQLALIVQSSKYGDEYFKVAKKISSISPDTIAHNSYLAKRIPVQKINPKTLQSKYIETLERTGKWGWKKLQKIGAWVAKHPKMSTAGGAYAWYVLDPVGFEEQMKSSGKSLSLFLMGTVGSIASGTGEAVTEKVEEVKDSIKKDIDHFMDKKVEDFKSSTSYIVTGLVGIMVLIFLFIVWRKRKIIYHFLTKADEIEINSYKEKYEKDDDEF